MILFQFPFHGVAPNKPIPFKKSAHSVDIGGTAHPHIISTGLLISAERLLAIPTQESTTCVSYKNPKEL